MLIIHSFEAIIAVHGLVVADRRQMLSALEKSRNFVDLSWLWLVYQLFPCRSGQYFNGQKCCPLWWHFLWAPV